MPKTYQNDKLNFLMPTRVLKMPYIFFLIWHEKLDEDLVNYFNKTDRGYSKILRLRNNTDLDELRDKAADRTEWQCLVEKLVDTTGEVDYSDESTTEAEV